MEPKLDPLPTTRQASRDQVERLRREDAGFYAPTRRRLPVMVSAGIAFALASGAFFGAETILPAEYKPSRFIGSYESAIANAQAKGRAEGELSTRIEYDKKLKILETQAVALQEACRAEFQRTNALYQAAWNRANLGYQLAGDLQKQYMSVRYSVAQSTTGGEVGMANLATTLGYIGGLFDPEFGAKALNAADSIRNQALAKIDDAARNGKGVDFSDWSKGLPDPATLQPLPRCSMPTTLSSGEAAN